MHLTTGWRRVLGDQLLDEKHLGKKNCELGEEDIAWVCETFLAFKEKRAQQDLRPCRLRLLEGDSGKALRIEGIDPNRAYKPEPMRPLEEIRGNILPMERVTKALLGEILGEVRS